jgi:hypothetical protein
MARCDVHRLALLEHGSVYTRCGIRLSDTDTSRGYYDEPIETTHFDVRTTCPDCRRKIKFPDLRVVK